MNVLYLGRYKNRYLSITRLIDLAKDKQILDLCFGDIYIAEFCKKNKLTWFGIDINDEFVNYALKNNYNALNADLSLISSLPNSDVCIISGSLYHFYSDLDSIFGKIFNCTSRLIISEPVINLTSYKGFIGKMASFLSQAGKGNESFRFTEKSLIDILNTFKVKYNFDYRVISIKRDMIIEVNKTH